jgi:hypothetical protein
LITLTTGLLVPSHKQNRRKKTHNTVRRSLIHHDHGYMGLLAIIQPPQNGHSMP